MLPCTFDKAPVSIFAPWHVPSRAGSTESVAAVTATAQTSDAYEEEVQCLCLLKKRSAVHCKLNSASDSALIQAGGHP